MSLTALPQINPSIAIFGMGALAGTAALSWNAVSSLAERFFSSFTPDVVKNCIGTSAVNNYLSGMGNQSALKTTPNYAYQFIHPDYYHAPQGETGLRIKDEAMIGPEKVDFYYEYFKSELNRNPELREDAASKCPPDPDQKGCILTIDGHSILYQVAPIKLKNHRASIDSLRSWTGRIDELSEKEITQKILRAHSLLFKGINVEDKGTYRRKEMIVYQDNDEDQDRSIQGLSNLILKKGGTQENVRTFRKYILRNDPDTPLSEAEKKAISFIGFAPCSVPEVPQKMLQFVKDLRDSVIEMKQCGQIDPIALGAFAHRKIGEIHPFTDGNGRIARALMNSIFMEYGVEPAIFLSDKKYTEAFEEDARGAGRFTAFLQEHILPQTRQVIDQFFKQSE